MMTTEQIELAQVPALLAKNARIGRVIAAQNARLESLAEDIEWTTAGLSDWWNLEANHASVGAAGFLAALQGASWMLGKMHGTDPQPIYEEMDREIGLD